MKFVFSFALIVVAAVTGLARTEIKVEVDGVSRSAIVHEGTGKSKKSPVLFVFHGHGGKASIVERRFGFHTSWKEAIVVYMQGIPGVSGITDREGVRNGWQMNPGDLGDRDLKFFDEMLARVTKDFKVDKNRVYAVGHSNGARFVNVLWKSRADKFAAFCAAAGPGGLMINGATPRSIWISMGTSDRIVPFENQKRSADFVKQMLKVDEKKAKSDGDLTTYELDNDVELVIEIRDAGHQFPVESIPKIVEFFKRKVRNVKK